MEEQGVRREAWGRELEEQRRREQMEQEQRRLAAARDDREAASRRGPSAERLREAYISEVQATVERRWLAPEGASASDLAVVLIHINPDTGHILRSDVQRCSGGEAFCDSVHQTMERLQSLPRPPDAEAVRGGIRIRFSPQG